MRSLRSSLWAIGALIVSTLAAFPAAAIGVAALAFNAFLSIVDPRPQLALAGGAWDSIPATNIDLDRRPRMAWLGRLGSMISTPAAVRYVDPG